MINKVLWYKDSIKRVKHKPITGEIWGSIQNIYGNSTNLKIHTHPTTTKKCQKPCKGTS